MPTSTRRFSQERIYENEAQRILSFRRALGEVKLRILAGQSNCMEKPYHALSMLFDRARVPRADLEFWADFRSIFAIEISRGGGPPPLLVLIRLY